MARGLRMIDRMRATMLLVSLALVGGCSRNPLYIGDDAGTSDGAVGSDAGSDGAVRLDLAGQSCSQLIADAKAWIASHGKCSKDSDCTNVSTRCDFPGACTGAYIDVAGAPGLQAIVMAAGTVCPTAQPCACPALPQLPAGCNDGVCGPKSSSPTLIGSACTSDPQCPDLLCILESPFSGGYCSSVQLDCAHANCESGSSCRQVTLQASPPVMESLCLKTCGGNSECRTNEGYLCCAAGSGSSKVCVPGKNGGCP
jgi:hypothetical protein